MVPIYSIKQRLTTIQVLGYTFCYSLMFKHTERRSDEEHDNVCHFSLSCSEAKEGCSTAFEHRSMSQASLC